MAITKAWLKQARSRLIESQARLCRLARHSREALEAEHKRHFPRHAATADEDTCELLRQLLHHELVQIIPDVLTD